MREFLLRLEWALFFLIIPSCRNKAVVDGAVSFYLDHFVQMRVSRMVYGLETRRRNTDTDPECLVRAHTAYYFDDGELCIPKAFQPILLKVKYFSPG
jgi:hypothetical protein